MEVDQRRSTSAAGRGQHQLDHTNQGRAGARPSQVRIAVSGKGGVGKTTLSGLLIARLLARGCAPVLAVDADPNLCLDRTLGVEATVTVGGVREEAKRIAAEGKLSNGGKQEMLELKIAQSLVEGDGFDLIAMGRPEGAGCYCYANNVLKEVIRHLAVNYPFTVIDNEAGLENLSRRIVAEVDCLILVSDPSQRGLETLRRLHALALEMQVRFDRLFLVINRCRNGRLPAGCDALQAATGAERVLALPEDAELARLAEEGGSLLTVAAANPAAAVVDVILDHLNAAAPAVRT